MIVHLKVVGQEKNVSADPRTRKYDSPLKGCGTGFQFVCRGNLLKSWNSIRQVVPLEINPQKVVSVINFHLFSKVWTLKVSTTGDG